MDYETQFPVRASFGLEPLKVLIEALKSNERDFDGCSVADDAKALREKIEKYGQRVTDENGNAMFCFGLCGDDGAKFIGQFFAASIMLAEYREQLQFIGADAENDAAPAEMEV
jgi:hypothetical protein